LHIESHFSIRIYFWSLPKITHQEKIMSTGHIDEYATRWKVTHHWDGVPPYSFFIDIDEKGLVTVEGQSDTTGIFTRFGTEHQFSMAITNYADKSVTAYAGLNSFRIGVQINGYMTGTKNGQVFKGTWFAKNARYEEVPLKKHGIGV
jgi:hypothetical protein